jgi:hypothetical protein
MKFEIDITTIITTLAATLTILGFMRRCFNSMIAMNNANFVSLRDQMTAINKDLCARIDMVNSDLVERIDATGDNILDIDRRLCRIEGALMNKDCCMLRDGSQVKKAE